MTAYSEWQKQILAQLQPVIPARESLDNGRDDEAIAEPRRQLMKSQPQVYATLQLTPAQRAADQRWATQHLTPEIMARHEAHMAKLVARSKVEGVEEEPNFSIGTRVTRDRSNESGSVDSMTAASAAK